MSTKRRRFSPAEKARIALEAIKGELTMAGLVAKYAVHATQINSWRKQAIECLPEVFGTTAKQEAAAHHEELSALYEEIGRLKVANDFLKKKFDQFSSD